MNDIVPELLDKIQKDFQDQVKKSNKLKALRKLIDDKQATYEQANEYAVEIGEMLARSFKKHISSSVLPDGKMYYNIGERILNPTLTKNYDMVASITKEIQEELNRQVGIGLKVSVPKVDKDKIKGIVDRLSSEAFDDVSWILQEPVITFTHNAVNDVLEENSAIQYNAGLTPKIKRTLVGGACKWCVSLAGSYTYPDIPDDVYKRHDRCRCVVTYESKKSDIKKVHSGTEGKRRYVKDKYGNYKLSKEERIKRADEMAKTEAQRRALARQKRIETWERKKALNGGR